VDDHTVITLMAMGCLTALEAAALLSEADGQYLLPVAGLLAALGGITGGLAIVEKAKQLKGA